MIGIIETYLGQAIAAVRFAYSPAGIMAAALLPGVWVALVLQAADVATTVIGLRRGAREANGLVREIMAELGRAWPLVKLAVIPLLPALALSWPVVWCFNAIMAWIVGNNCRVIAEQ